MKVQERRNKCFLKRPLVTDQLKTESFQTVTIYKPVTHCGHAFERVIDVADSYQVEVSRSGSYNNPQPAQADVLHSALFIFEQAHGFIQVFHKDWIGPDGSRGPTPR